MKLRHYFTHYSSLGGVQSILGTHLKYDGTAGLTPTLLAFFDSNVNRSGNEKVKGLNWHGLSSIQGARASFRQHEFDNQYDCCVYHDLWGLAFLADLDHCHYRIGAIHSHWPHLEFQLKQLDGFVDGVFCDSQALADLAIKCIPGLTPDRAIHLPVPIKTCPPKYRQTRTPLKGRPLKLGFVGRLDHLQKRVERFIPMVECLDQRGIQYELEFLGDGTARRTLENAFKGKDHIRMHGKKSGDDYWRILGTWDFVIYTSDFEGSPLAMQEALNAGCIPIFPRINCGGDLVVEELHSSLLYPQEDYPAVASILMDWSKRSNEFVEQIRKQAIILSSEYAEEKYHAKFMNFLTHITSQPAISLHPVPSRSQTWTDYLPFSAIRRWCPKAFFKYQTKQLVTNPDR